MSEPMEAVLGEGYSMQWDTWGPQHSVESQQQ